MLHSSKLTLGKEVESEFRGNLMNSSTMPRLFMIAFLSIIVSSCGSEDSEGQYPDIDLLGEWTAIFTADHYTEGFLQEFKIHITAQDGDSFSGHWGDPSVHKVRGYIGTSNEVDWISFNIYSENIFECGILPLFPGQSSTGHFNELDYYFDAQIQSSDRFTDYDSRLVHGCGRIADGRMTISRISPCIVSETITSEGVNIDFGRGTGIPCPSYPAAGNQVGEWNNINDVTGRKVSLTTLSGAPSPLKISVTAQFSGTHRNLGYEITDSNFIFLLNDYFYSPMGAAWTVSITGVPNGTYSLFIYAPGSNVRTGDMTINGKYVPSISGGSSLTEGTSYIEEVVTISNGTLSMSGANSWISGLSGLQLIPSD